MSGSGKALDDILVVDDAPANLKLLEQILSEAGYRVRLATEGELALRSAKIQPPALILLDIRMPGMDGYEVCKRLKAIETTSSIPVIFLSALEDERDKLNAFEAGGVDYITKPIHSLEVLARIGIHLSLRHAQMEAESRNAELEAIRETLEERVKERSAELVHRNRELAAIRTCNQEIVRAEDEQALLSKICGIICDKAGYRMTWAGYAEDDDAKTVRPVAWAGVEGGYLARARITWADTDRGRGPTGAAIRSGKSACIQDFDLDPEAAPWREEAARRGYRSAISLPLKDRSGIPFGALCIYSTEPNIFNESEVRLLDELAGDVAFGIGVLRARATLRQAEQERQEYVKFLESLDRINRAIQGASNLDQMMSEVLDAVVSVFECDRAFLAHAGDPGARAWKIVMERGGPGRDRRPLSGVLDPGDPDVGRAFRAALAASGPVGFRAGAGYSARAKSPEGVEAQTQLAMALRPQTGQPWMFVIGEALSPRAWTPQEERLFEEIGRRVSDSLSRLLAYRDLRESERKYRRLVDSNIIGIVILTLDGKILEANDAFLAMVGYSREELIAGHVNRSLMTPPQWDSATRQSLEELKANGSCKPFEKEYFRKDGSRVPVLIGSALFEPNGQEGITFVLDLTESKKDKERLEAMMEELNHRVKNTLATVRALSEQTFRTADSPEAFQEAFEGRLLALSQTHNLLNRSCWTGVSVRDLLTQELAPYAGADNGRLTLAGEDVELGPVKAVTLGMAFHELATNAAKYGALSVPGGRVKAAWNRREPGRLHLEWRETGGPPVSPPKRRGFGSRLIEKTLPAGLDGEARLQFLKEGLRCEMDIALGEKPGFQV